MWNQIYNPLGNAALSTIAAAIPVVTLLVLICVYLFFRHTRLGLAMRGAAFNPTSSRLVGVRVGWMLALGWGLAAGIGAVAGCMVAPIVFLDPNMMSGVLLYAFAGALLGGITHPLGAAVILRRSLLIYGVGGIVAPFVGIKVIDVALQALHLV